MDGNSSRETTTQEEPDLFRWFVALAVGGAATIGVVILVFLVSLALQPPPWVQVVLGVVLAVGAAIFTWLVAKAWPSRESSRERPDRPERRERTERSRRTHSGG